MKRDAVLRCLMLIVLVGAFLLLSGCAKEVPPSIPEIIPQDTLNAVADYIIEGTYPAIDRDEVRVGAAENGKVDIYAKINNPSYEGVDTTASGYFIEAAFASCCEYLVTATEAALSKHGLELNTLTITAPLSAYSDSKAVTWRTRDLKTGNFSDNISEPSFVKGGYTVEDMREYFNK